MQVPREPLFASVAQSLMDETNDFAYRKGYCHPVMQVAFEAMGDSHTWLGPMASLLVTLALISPERNAGTWIEQGGVNTP